MNESYVADLLVLAPNFVSARNDARTWKCVMTGAGGFSAAESLAKALATLESFYLNPEEAGYARGRVVVYQLCSHCDGGGQIAKGKRPRRMVPCPKCKGEAHAPVAEASLGSTPAK